MMKHKIKLLMAPLVLALLFFACEEHEHLPISSDSTNPSMVENVVLTPINGGFNISYDLPPDNDLLFVKAVYTNSLGEEIEVKTSKFNNKIQILGLGDTSEISIRIYSGDRSENLSNPVTISGSPLTPPVFIIQETMSIVEDFGGAKFSWINELKTPISVELLVGDENGELSVVKTVYTEQSSLKLSLRGYESVPTLFAAVIRDRYDNFSDTIYANTPDRLLTPLLETRLDKTMFNQVILSNDVNWSAWGAQYSNTFDDDFDSFNHTQGGDPFPQIMTVDLGVNVALSRFTVHQRPNWYFTHGNPKRYNVYGAKELPASDDLDDPAWILLRECESIKPSGLPIGQNTNEDLDHFFAGDEFTFEEQTEIRYFRFAVFETWDGAGYVDFSELTFWGSVKD